MITCFKRQLGIASILITMDSVETQHNETKEYPFARFISDVGGSLGLFMAMN